jgi:DNA-binding NarL/FixJ family response regulator
MDINLPGNSGIQCVEQLKKVKPSVQFLMCTSLQDAEKIFSALSVGATGYITKNTTTEKLTQAIKEIYQGGSPMSPQIARKVTEAFVKDKKHKEQVGSLTKREKEIIDLLAAGHPYKEIADCLSLKIDTIRTYIRDIYLKLQVHNRTDAINKLYPKTQA